MKIRSITAVAFAGLASAAAGQSLLVTLSFDATEITIGETATATLSATFTGHPAGAYISSINIDLIASSNSFAVSNVAGVAWNNLGLGFDGQGTASGSNVLGIEASQFSLIPPITAGSPILITTFTVTRTSEAGIDWSAQAANGAPFLFSVTGGAFSDPVISYGAEAFQSGSFGVLPAPSGIGFIAMGAALCARRRRCV